MEFASTCNTTEFNKTKYMNTFSSDINSINKKGRFESTEPRIKQETSTNNEIKSKQHIQKRDLYESEKNNSNTKFSHLIKSISKFKTNPYEMWLYANGFYRRKQASAKECTQYMGSKYPQSYIDIHNKNKTEIDMDRDFRPSTAVHRNCTSPFNQRGMGVNRMESNEIFPKIKKHNLHSSSTKQNGIQLMKEELEWFTSNDSTQDKLSQDFGFREAPFDNRKTYKNMKLAEVSKQKLRYIQDDIKTPTKNNYKTELDIYGVDESNSFERMSVKSINLSDSYIDISQIKHNVYNSKKKETGLLNSKNLEKIEKYEKDDFLNNRKMNNLKNLSGTSSIKNSKNDSETENKNVIIQKSEIKDSNLFTENVFVYNEVIPKVNSRKSSKVSHKVINSNKYSNSSKINSSKNIKSQIDVKTSKKSDSSFKRTLIAQSKDSFSKTIVIDKQNKFLINKSVEAEISSDAFNLNINIQMSQSTKSNKNSETNQNKYYKDLPSITEELKNINSNNDDQLEKYNYEEKDIINLRNLSDKDELKMNTNRTYSDLVNNKSLSYEKESTQDLLKTNRTLSDKNNSINNSTDKNYKLINKKKSNEISDIKALIDGLKEREAQLESQGAESGEATGRSAEFHLTNAESVKQVSDIKALIDALKERDHFSDLHEMSNVLPNESTYPIHKSLRKKTDVFSLINDLKHGKDKYEDLSYSEKESVELSNMVEYRTTHLFRERLDNYNYYFSSKSSEKFELSNHTINSEILPSESSYSANVKIDQDMLPSESSLCENIKIDQEILPSESSLCENMKIDQEILPSESSYSANVKLDQDLISLETNEKSISHSELSQNLIESKSIQSNIISESDSIMSYKYKYIHQQSSTNESKCEESKSTFSKHYNYPFDQISQTSFNTIHDMYASIEQQNTPNNYNYKYSQPKLHNLNYNSDITFCKHHSSNSDSNLVESRFKKTSFKDNDTNSMIPDVSIQLDNLPLEKDSNQIKTSHSTYQNKYDASEIIYNLTRTNSEQQSDNHYMIQSGENYYNSKNNTEIEYNKFEDNQSIIRNSIETINSVKSHLSGSQNPSLQSYCSTLEFSCNKLLNLLMDQVSSNQDSITNNSFVRCSNDSNFVNDSVSGVIDCNKVFYKIINEISNSSLDRYNSASTLHLEQLDHYFENILTKPEIEYVNSDEFSKSIELVSKKVVLKTINDIMESKNSNIKSNTNHNENELIYDIPCSINKTPSNSNMIKLNLEDNEEMDIVELELTKRSNFQKSQLSDRIVKPEKMDTERLFENRQTHPKDTEQRHMSSKDADPRFSSHQPGLLKSSTLNNVDVAESKMLYAVSSSPLKSEFHFKPHHFYEIKDQNALEIEPIESESSSYNVSLNLMLTRVNGTIKNMEREEGNEKERGEFIKFLTSSIFANAIKVLCDD